MSDVSSDEINKHLNGLKGVTTSKNRFMSRLFSLDTLYDNIPPDSVNWTAQGYVTPVENQGFCGSKCVKLNKLRFLKLNTYRISLYLSQVVMHLLLQVNKIIVLLHI